MRKKLLAFCGSLALLFSLVTPVLASAETEPIITPNCTYKYNAPITNKVTTVTGNLDSTVTGADTLTKVLQIFADGYATNPSNQKQYTLEPSKAYKITIASSASLTETLNKKVIITATQPEETDGSDENESNELIIYNTDSVTITSQKSGGTACTHAITFEQGLEVQKDATMTLSAAMGNLTPV